MAGVPLLRAGRAGRSTPGWTTRSRPATLASGPRGSTALDRYAVIGHPVEHSLSPRIHAAFARQTGAVMAYGRIDPGRNGFVDAARGFFADGGRGLNVTVPFKAEAFTICTSVSARAERAGVVNTLAPTERGAIAGDNTDGAGLVRDLAANLGVRLAGARILLVGAGGASRGVLGPLLAATPAAVVVANRTPERAHAVAADFADAGPVRGCGLDADATGTGFGLVINASAASLGGAVPAIDPAVLGPGCVVYDMMYGEAARPFLDWALTHGAEQAVDGLGMLVEQAAESFRVWRGTRPATAAVLAELRAGA